MGKKVYTEYIGSGSVAHNWKSSDFTWFDNDQAPKRMGMLKGKECASKKGFAIQFTVSLGFSQVKGVGGGGAFEAGFQVGCMLDPNGEIDGIKKSKGSFVIVPLWGVGGAISAGASSGISLDLNVYYYKPFNYWKDMGDEIAFGASASQGKEGYSANIIYPSDFLKEMKSPIELNWGKYTIPGCDKLCDGVVDKILDGTCQAADYILCKGGCLPAWVYGSFATLMNLVSSGEQEAYYKCKDACKENVVKPCEDLEMSNCGRFCQIPTFPGDPLVEVAEESGISVSTQLVDLGNAEEELIEAKAKKWDLAANAGYGRVCRWINNENNNIINKCLSLD